MSVETLNAGALTPVDLFSISNSLNPPNNEEDQIRFFLSQSSSITITFFSSVPFTDSGAPSVSVHSSGGNTIAATQIQLDQFTTVISSTSELSGNTSYFLDVLGSETVSYTVSVSATGTPPSDDYADSLSDSSRPVGQVSVGGGFVFGSINFSGDRDWLSVQLTAGITYVINLE